MERKSLTLYVILACLSHASPVIAEPEGFLGKNTVEARRILQNQQENSPRHLSALAFLEYLEGNEAEARRIWEKCDQECRKDVPEAERVVLENTKAQKRPL